MDSSHSLVRSSARSFVAFHVIVDDERDLDFLTVSVFVLNGGLEWRAINRRRMHLRCFHVFLFQCVRIPMDW